MNGIKIELRKSLPPKDALNDLLSQHYKLAVQRMRDLGFEIDPAAPRSAMAEFWKNADDYLPPKGCLVVARNSSGAIVGCAMMKRFDDQTGEIKRVFVTDDTRGTGTGRKLTETCEKTARSMGLKRLIADSLTSNVEMRGLLPKLGFVALDTPIESSSYKDQPMLRPHLHYFTKDI